MIETIQQLKFFGRYYDFSWKDSIPKFKKLNLIYGWNRSGKTTLSRVFSSCEKRCTFSEKNFNTYPENGEFKIKIDDSTIITDSNVAENNLKIMVFNEDFVKENISFDDSNSCAPIVIVSKEDIEITKKLNEMTTLKDSLQKELSEAKKNKEDSENAKSLFLTDVGREIKNSLFDSTYNKTKAENRISEIGINNFQSKILSVEKIKQLVNISKGEPPKTQQIVEKLNINIIFNNKSIKNLKDLYKETQSVLNTNITSAAIDRLKKDSALNSWVEIGLSLHKQKGEFNKCLFCQNSVEKIFFDKLSGHFDKDYSEFKNKIGNLKSKICKLKQDGIAIENKNLHPELKNSFINHSSNLNKIIADMNDWLDLLIAELDKKYENPFNKISLSESPKDFILEYNERIDSINKLYFDHNKKVENHEAEIEKAKEEIELHLIADANSQKDYQGLCDDLVKKEEKVSSLSKKLQNIVQELKELQEQTSNIGIAISEINQYLKDFFGREEVSLELDETQTGYYIINNGAHAKCLSEGEKTAIAFAYFLAKTKEKEFDLKNGIIFIDDPISSFDTNFIYHCYSLITNHFNEAQQLFISTHNFQFFNLIKGWFMGKDNYENKCGFYMIENFLESCKRHARIIKLDDTLRKNKSEYQFLFNLIYKFQSPESNKTYEDLYTIGNIARRFFDIFADFKIPDSRDQKSKMREIVREINERNGSEIISVVEWNKVYKLINEYSHNSDPSSSLEHKNKMEILEAIKTLLSIVKKSDPTHFSTLVRSIN